MEHRKNEVLVLGSSNIDIVVRVDKLPSAGETVLGGKREDHFGGKGANQALAAARAGAEVRFITMLGGDPGGDAYRRHLAKNGISPDGVLCCGEGTGTALILVDQGGENQIAVAPGANGFLTPGRMRRKPGLLDFGEVVLAQLEVPVPSVAAAFRMGKKTRRPQHPEPGAGAGRFARGSASADRRAGAERNGGGASGRTRENPRAGSGVPAHRARLAGDGALPRHHHGGGKRRFFSGRGGGLLADAPRRASGGGRDGCGRRLLRRARGQARRGRAMGGRGSLRRGRGVLFGAQTRGTRRVALAPANHESPKRGARKTDAGRLT